jgi:hypothetical protein
MSELQRAGQSGALDVAGDQVVAKDQLGALLDMLRQLGGNANMVAGSAASADPLSGPFHLYVHPHRGSDRFVGGQYNTHESGATDEEIIAQKLRRISLQQLECGYTKQRPFRSVNRAIIEAAIITSRSWYTFNDERAHVDCVVIELSANRHIVYNNPGSATANLASWGTSKDPTIEDLIAFNPPTGGVLVPRGASIPGKILRKTTLRPNWIPAFADEAADYSNRRQMLLVTGTADAFQFTVMDKIGQSESCHLFSAIGAASQSELNLFYDKIESAVGAGADLASALLAARPTEYETPGPIDQTQAPSEDWNTVDSASPYPFQVSVRSKWGMGSVFWDGAKMAGLKSMVRANFTNTNQQRDLRCFQVYENGEWVTLANDSNSRAKYYAANPDNRRYHPARLSYGLLAVRDAYLQDVSIFGIGLARRTRVDSGADVTDSTGNTTFGGLSGEAIGYKSFAFEKDKNWAVSRIQVPLNISEKLSSISRIQLGVIQSVTSSAITLIDGLATSGDSATVPALLLANGYTLASGTRIWVENPNGADWRGTLTGSAWSSSASAVINITEALQESDTNAAAGNSVVGRRVYIRRIKDTRTPPERRVSLILSNTASSALPGEDQILQTDPSRSGGAISRVLAGGGEEVLIVTETGTGPAPGAGVIKTSQITIRRGAPNRTYSAGTFFRSGTVVRHAGKHWQAKQDLISAGSDPDTSLWIESHHHMSSEYNPPDPRANEIPIIVLNTDTSSSENDLTLGINWTTVWTSAGSIRDQYRTGTDYLGAYAFLRTLGFSDAAAHAALVPRAAAGRSLDPSSATDFPTAPSGGAASGLGNWAVEFRRPSTLRKTNHVYEWAGWGNYDTALPSVQGNMSDANQFYSYAVNVAGGNVVFEGTNQDGFNVTPRGLESIATGATVSPEGLGGQSIDEAQRTDFPNGIQVDGEAILADVVISGNADFGSQSQATTTKTGVVQLAPIAKLIATGSNAAVASTDASLEAEPEAVTIGGLNRWRQAQRLVSTATGSITIFVQGSAADRTLEQMLENPPTTTATAIPTLARAAEYANAIIGGGNQTAEIRIAPGLYDPASVWECDVVFRASDPTVADWPLIFPETITGNATTDNNYFDGSGYGNFTTRVNFRSFTLALRSASASGNNLQVNVIGRQIRCKRSVDFRGGFHFLGIPELIKAVADNAMTAAQLLSGSVDLPGGAYTADVTTNVNTFLNQLRVSNSRNASYTAWTTTAPLFLNGPADALANIRGIVFGPILPSRKEVFTRTRDAYIAVRGEVPLRFSNIYLRGTTSISSASIGVTNALPFSSSAHYGSASVSAPWTWRQTHHTFLSSLGEESNPIYIDQLGADINYPLSGGDSTQTYFQNLTTYLPNHIHLQTAAGAVPGDDDTGPFFDQFVHAKTLLSVRQSFLAGFTGAAAGGATQGFFGRFGSNGHNTVKTRGVLLGNQGFLDQERGATVILGSKTIQEGSDHAAAFVGTIFAIAGISKDTRNTSVPKYVIGSATFGEPNPLGAVDRKFNPVITSAGLNQADGVFGLNMGLRSYARGISPEHGFNVTPNAVL